MRDRGKPLALDERSHNASRCNPSASVNAGCVKTMQSPLSPAADMPPLGRGQRCAMSRHLAQSQYRRYLSLRTLHLMPTTIDWFAALCRYLPPPLPPPPAPAAADWMASRNR